jgi:hypothetical protein
MDATALNDYRGAKNGFPCTMDRKRERLGWDAGRAKPPEGTLRTET